MALGWRSTHRGGAAGIRLLAITGGRGVNHVSRPEAGAYLRRALPHHVRHVDPGVAVVRAGAPSSGRLHRRLGERQQALPRRAVGASAHHREHRNRSRDRPDHEAAVRGAVDRLRDGEARGVHLHPRRHRRDPRARHLATRSCGRIRRDGRVHARGDQGLDVPAWTGLGRRLGERVDPRLHDVSHRARASADDLARARGRAAAHHLRHRNLVQRQSSEQHAARAAKHRDHPGVRLGALPRRLLHHLGLQARCPDPEQECASIPSGSAG